VYLKVLKLYFTGIVELLLTGWTWTIGFNLASLRILKVRRKFTKPVVDWGATRKLLAERPDAPRDTLVYFTNQPFWYKTNCNLVNKTVYRFDPTSGPDGNGRKITRLLEADPLAHLNFTTKED
jgi:hypothetical protein